MKRIVIMGLAIVVLVGVGVLGALPFLGSGDELRMPMPNFNEGDFVVKVVGEDGKFIQGARVKYNAAGIARNYAERFVKADGTASMPLTRAEVKRGMTLWVTAPGHASMQAEWPQGAEIPAEFTFTMKKGSPIGGMVKNQKGEPVRGAKVGIYYNDGTPEEPGKARISGNDTVQTNAEGKWKISTVPADMENFNINVSHPHYISNRNYSSVNKSDAARYRKLIAEHTLKEGLKLVGRVTDPAGNPLSGAFVALGREPYQYHQGNAGVPKTDAAGNFQVRNAKAGTELITVLHPSYAPAQREVTVKEGMEPAEVQLSQGEKLTFIVKNEQGQPIANAHIYPSQWNGNNALNFLSRYGIPTQTDSEGKIVWENAPSGEISFYASSTDYAYKNDITASARPEPYEITLKAPLKITGSVVDAKSRTEISDFQIVRGYKHNESSDHIDWQRWDVTKGSGGKFEVVERNSTPVALRVQAPGYLPATSPVFQPGGGPMTHDFELQPGVGPEGEVYDADGKPVAGVSVAVFTAQQQAHVYEGRIQSNEGTTAQTDANGKFTLNPQSDDYSVAAANERGFAIATQTELAANKRLVLKPWAKITGVVLVGKEPQDGTNVNYNSTPGTGKQGEPMLYAYGNATTDSRGRFTIERVLPGVGSVSMNEQVETSQGTFGITTRSVPFEVASGGSTEVTVGGSGRPVIGKAVLPEGMAEGIDLTAGFHSLQQQLDPGTERDQLRYMRQQRIQFRLKEDGTFRVEDVPPGKYELHINIREADDRNPFFGGRGIGRLQHSFEVADVPEGEEPQPVDVGELDVQPSGNN